jgi:vacuolar-type H+-ATPase subunit C/Vma6
MYKYLYNLNKKVIKEEMFNICFIFSYLSILDIEIKNIINIVEGIRYKIDRQELKKKLIV